MPSPTPDPQDVPRPLSGAARACPVRYGFSLEPGEGLEAQEDGDYIRYEDYAWLEARLALADSALKEIGRFLRATQEGAGQ